MKLIKESLVKEELLKEAEGEIDLDQKPADIADAIKDVTKEAGKDISDAEAKDAANLANDAGAALKTDEVFVDDDDAPIGVKNKLTNALDSALKVSIRNRKMHINEGANVLVTGLPGSSKTATVYDWAKAVRVPGNWSDEDIKQGKDRVHITYLNAKNNDIDAFINGYTVQDPNDKLTVKQAVSDNLNGLDAPNSILFLDEYNRQTKAQIRASLLTLINEHYVTGREVGGRHYFKNFLFTIAAINPGGTAEDEGAAMLNDAERTRFLYKVKDFDSDPDVTKEYLYRFYVKKAKDELEKQDPDWELIEAFLRIWDIGTFICNDSRFEYDGKNTLNKLYLTQGTMLNQRTLTQALAASYGDVNALKDYITDSSDFLSTNIDLLIDILEDYEHQIPTLDILLAKAGFNKKQPEKSAAPEKDKAADAEKVDADVAAATADADIEVEDDPDLFVGGNNAAKKGAAPTPDEAQKALNDAVSSWF